ncbi:hypothetical protein GJ496_000452 [Pomphorhynchus laevis]|nr:hypothetical protein GJ496_000452 [Pomphorhynchus laevis]
MNRERRKVRSIEIDSPVEVTFLDHNEHDVILCAEREALEAVNARRREIEEGDTRTIDGSSNAMGSKLSHSYGDTDDVEVVRTVKEHGDQHIQRKIETKSYISEDPNTKRKVTKVVKTETTEVTKIYLIETDEDAKNVAYELGLSDMSQIIAEGGISKPTRWKQPQILRESLHRKEPSHNHDEFVLVTSDGTQISESYVKHGEDKKRRGLLSKSSCTENSKFATLCNCAARRKKEDVKFSKIRKEDIRSTSAGTEPKMSIRKRIQESTKRYSISENEPIIDNHRKNLIKQHNMQLSTFIFDVMCKIGIYTNEEEKNRGRKVISRGLDLLYYDRCKTWPEFTNQLVNENDEYTSTNHIVIPTANVIEYIMISYPDLIGLIDSVPGEKSLGDIKIYADRPFTKLPAMHSINLKDITTPTYEDRRGTITSSHTSHVGRPRHDDTTYTEKSSMSSELPTAHLLSIINDHDRLIPRVDRKCDHGQHQLPDVVASPHQATHPHICGIITDNKDLPSIKGGKVAKHSDKLPGACNIKCFSCFGGSTKERRKSSTQKHRESDKVVEILDISTVNQPSTDDDSKRLGAPAVHWPSISVGKLPSYDTPDIILVEKHKQSKRTRSKPEIEVYADVDIPKAYELKDKDKKIDDYRIKSRETYDIPTHAIIQREENIPLDELARTKLDETVDVLEGRAMVTAEIHATKNLDVKLKEPVRIVEPREFHRPDEYQQTRQHSNIRNILDCHRCMSSKEPKLHFSMNERVDKKTTNITKGKLSERLSKDDKRDAEPRFSTVEKICGIITCHQILASRKKKKAPTEIPSGTTKCTDNVCNMIRFHDKHQHHQQRQVSTYVSEIGTDKLLDMQQQPSVKPVHRTKSNLDGVCTRCFTSKSKDKQKQVSKSVKKPKRKSKSNDQHIRQNFITEPIEATKSKTKPHRRSGESLSRSQKLNIGVPSFQLPDIPLSGRRNLLLDMPYAFTLLRKRLNQIFPGENADQLLDEICLELNNGQPADKVRTKLIGRYPLAMIDLVILSMSFVERDYEAGFITEEQVPEALVKVLDDNRTLYSADAAEFAHDGLKLPQYRLTSISTDTQTVLPAGGGQSKIKAGVIRPPSKCFSCASEKTITVPMSPDCIKIMDSLQRIPSSQLPNLSNRIASRMRVTWNLDKTNASETSKLIKKILPRIRDAQVASILLLSNDLKNENPKFFYAVDPCIDVIQLLATRYDLGKPITDADIDNILHEIGEKYAGVGLLGGFQYPSKVAWLFQPTNMQNLVDTTERRIISSSSDPSLQRKHRKLNKIIQDAYNLMAKRQVANTTDLRSQLHRLYPKDSQLVEYVVFDIEEGLRSGRLQQECGHSSVRILINILHSKDIESCRIQNGDDRLLSDRALDNLKQNKYLLTHIIKEIIFDAGNSSLPSVQNACNEENLDELIDYAINEAANIKTFEELTDLIKKKAKHESTAELLVLLLEQAYFATEFENPDSKDALALMKDRLYGKPLVLREICFAIPDHSTIECRDHRGNYSLTTSPAGKLINVGQGLTWREANERARILFYRGRKPAVRYNDALDGFDVRMILEQDGCVHEIPVSPEDVKRLLNSCGLYWDGLNISLLGKSDEILHRAEQEAFKILRETGFLHSSVTELNFDDNSSLPTKNINKSQVSE